MSQHPSLEHLIESGDFGLDILHPGGLAITQELAGFCGITGGSRVLDVASGTGETACYLTETLGAQVVGIDGSARMVEQARARAERRNLAIEFQQGDAHRLPFRDDTFDVVISECTLCILDKQRAIREMVRVVVPGGSVGFHDICWSDDTPERMKRRLAEIEQERPETLEGWRDLCEEAGLADIQAIDRSSLIPAWMKETRQQLGVRNVLKLVRTAVRLWGIRGLRDILESTRILQSRYTGYGILVGRKAS